MATNPDQLLIFKLRGMGQRKQGVVAQTVSKEEPKVEQKAPEAPKTLPKPVFVPKVEEKPVAVAPKATMQKEVAEQPKPLNLFKPQVQEAPKAAQRQEEQMLVESMVKPSVQVQELAREKEQEFISRKGIVTQKEQMEGAKGLKCVNHPWREAYALSAYSNLPYCYADVVDYSGKFYSVDDVDKVAGRERRMQKPSNSFTKLASYAFVLNGIILLYYTLPQIGYILGYASGLAPSNVLGNLNSAYSIPLFNLALSVLSVLAGILVLLTEERGIYLAGLVGTVILITASFEYLYSFETHLLVISVFALAQIVFLAYGRINATTTSYARDIVTPEIEWPRVETF